MDIMVRPSTRPAADARRLGNKQTRSGLNACGPGKVAVANKGPVSRDRESSGMLTSRGSSSRSPLLSPRGTSARAWRRATRGTGFPHVPGGCGPFNSFEDAAVDALVKCAHTRPDWKDWSIGGMLTSAANGNRLYAAKGIPSRLHLERHGPVPKGQIRFGTASLTSTPWTAARPVPAWISTMMELDPSIKFDGPAPQAQPNRPPPFSRLTSPCVTASGYREQSQPPWSRSRSLNSTASWARRRATPCAFRLAAGIGVDGPDRAWTFAAIDNRWRNGKPVPTPRCRLTSFCRRLAQAMPTSHRPSGAGCSICSNQR